MGRNQYIIRGRESIRKISELMEKLQIRRPMIVGMDQLPSRLFRLNPQLNDNPVFSGFHSNPDLADARNGKELFMQNKCDGIISIGGGSSIDTGKCIKTLLYLESENDIELKKYPLKMDIPHIAIPGTAGTGSETTQTAVIYIQGNKYSLDHPDLLPDGAILDSTLLNTLPVYQKKACALDALAQGIESYWCNSSTEDSRVHAYLAIIGVIDNLSAYLSGDPHAADEMIDASYQSGKAINITRTTAAHAMSYQLTKRYGFAHGHAVMLTLPTLWEMALEHDEMNITLMNLAKIMRFNHPLVVPRFLRGIMIDLEMEIPDMPDGKTLQELADSVNAERLSNNPFPMSGRDVYEAYRKSFLPMNTAERQACLDIWKYYHLSDRTV